MSGFMHTEIRCDRDGCQNSFGPVVGPGSTTREHAAAFGWSHPSFGTDLCPAHKAVAS